MYQATHVVGIRRARYAGLDKTRLEHLAAATAFNVVRLLAGWGKAPLAFVPRPSGPVPLNEQAHPGPSAQQWPPVARQASSMMPARARGVRGGADGHLLGSLPAR